MIGEVLTILDVARLHLIDRDEGELQLGIANRAHILLLVQVRLLLSHKLHIGKVSEKDMKTVHVCTEYCNALSPP